MVKVACNHGCRQALWLGPETHTGTTHNRCPSLHPESFMLIQSSHLTILPATSLSTQLFKSFHPCFELGLNEPCLVFLHLTWTLCNNDSGSFPELPGTTLGKAPPGSTLPSALCTWRKESQTRRKQVLVSGRPQMERAWTF